MSNAGERNVAQQADPSVLAGPASQSPAASTSASSRATDTSTSDARQDFDVKYGQAPNVHGVDETVPLTNAGLDRGYSMPGALWSWLGVAQPYRPLVPLGMYHPGRIRPHGGSESGHPPPGGAFTANVDTTDGFGDNFENIISAVPRSQDGGGMNHPGNWWEGFVTGLGIVENEGI